MTFTELGYPDVNAFAYQGSIGPANMPPAVVDRLNAELRKALQSPELLKAFDTLGLEPAPGTPEEFRTTARALSAHWGTVIRRGQIPPGHSRPVQPLGFPTATKAAPAASPCSSC